MKIKLNLPAKTGVYLFKDKNQQVLYVGKATNLQERIKSHWRDDLHDPRLARLLARTAQIDYEVAASELEALLLEIKLIKTYLPFYNTRLKDNKRYLYVGFTKEKYPRVIFLRQPEKSSALLDWFGPFPNATSLKKLLRYLRRIFPYRTCLKFGKPCFYYHLHRCPGVCFQEVPEYRQTVKKLRLFLGGETEDLTGYLQRQLRQASRQENFEQAQALQEQILLIKKLLGRYQAAPERNQYQLALEELRHLIVKYQPVEPFRIHRLEGYDVANLGRQIIVGAMVVLTEGELDNQAYRQFKIRSAQINDPAGIREVLIRRLKHQEWLYPQVILVDGGRTQLSAAYSALAAYRLEKQIALIGLTKKTETVIVPDFSAKKWTEVNLPADSQVLQLLQKSRNEAHRFAQRYYHCLHHQLILPVSSSVKN
jgi:excinuclease ABC subunit C